MSSGALLSFTLFVSGLASLLIWFALTIGNPRLKPILRKSVVFFLLPGALMVVIPVVAPIPLMMAQWLGLWPGFILFLLLLVLLEEFLKMSAARSEALPGDKFALAMLFGIGELMLSKPIGPLLAGEMMGDWSRWGLIGVTIGATIAMLMHSVTAAVYAFRYPTRPWFALLMCFLVHTFYNFFVTAFLDVWTAVVVVIVLAGLLIALLPERAHADDVATPP